LFLPSEPAEGEGSRLFTLELSGRGGSRSITAQRFSAVVDSTVNVMLLSTVHSSPLEDALRVLRQPHVVIPVNEVAGSLNTRYTVIIDRDLLSETLCTATIRQSLAEWIRAGGNALVFPQHGRGAGWLTALCGALFESIDPLAPEAVVTTDTSTMFNTPNHIAPADWQGWVESRAFVNVRRPVPQVGAVQRAWSGQHALLVTVRVGKGTVTLVAADLLSQLTNCHSGAYRILANLIAHGGGR